MNILFVYTSAITPEDGGVQRVTAFLGTYLEEQHNKVFFLSAKKGRTSGELNPAQYFLPNEEELYHKENIAFYKDLVNGKKIDIIINQAALGGTMSSFCAHAKTSSNAKIISVIHNSLLGNVFNFTNSHSRQLKKFPIPFLKEVLETSLIKNVLRFLYRMKYSKSYQFMYDHSDQVVLLSEGYYEELRFFVPRFDWEKVCAIPNPCTLKSGDVPYTKLNEILYVGRLNTSQKKVDMLLKIWAGIYRQHPDWKLSIVGEGEEKEALETQTRCQGIERVTFYGLQDPVPFYKRSKILCMTSAYEGFPLVLAEAQLFGTIPVAFKSFASVKDIIANGNNGFLIEPFSAEKYINCISELMQNEEKMRSMSFYCRQSVSRFSIEAVGNRWLDLFNKLHK